MRLRTLLRQLPVQVVLAVVALIWIYPFIWMVSSSFKTNREFLSRGLELLPEQFRTENYVRAWEVANFSQYFQNSVIVTVSTVVIVVVISALTGYALARVQFPGKRPLIVLYAATLFIPKGYTIIPVYQLIRELGLLNTLPGLILAEAGAAPVLFALLFMAHFSGIPKELDEAAELDGATFGQTFIHVMLPLAKPMIATTVVLQFMWTWNSFFTPLVLTLNNPDLRTLTVGLYAFVGEYNTDWTGLTAAALISIVPVLVLFLALQRYFIAGLTGSVKS
ncbi:MAG: carbohydrate ABC transporter permease [Trueperaceae bacterium]|nr:MAG: carbohydrate ABC transporter permease [Trueperaceae bacterium]